MPESSLELERLYREAEAATAQGSKSFYFATRFFPPELARSAHAVYWFCRTTDDLVDEAPNAEAGRAAIDAWEREFESDSPHHPVLSLFREAVGRHSIPQVYPRDLIAGVRMDLTISRYERFEDLAVFCYRVASVVGLMMMHVIGYSGQPQQHAIDLGIALQLTNILRDIGEDWRRGRLYLPLEELHRFKVSTEDIANERRTDAFRELMRFQALRARDYYARGIAGIPALHQDGRFAVEIAAKVYAGILDRIERSDYDVFRKRAVVPAREKYWITARTMAPVIARRSAARMVFWR